jgi:anti-sigma regulatory factor (Ser/Thr protein kinase)
VARALRVSRQAAHRRLRALAARGAVVHQGGGRTARWTLPSSRDLGFDFFTEGLQEDRVWTDLRSRVPVLRALGAEATAILAYSITEMLNNAIEHSASAKVHVGLLHDDASVTFSVIDQGIGAFANIQRARKLASPLEALQDLTKGKVTTMPDRHTGEGLFFTSKAVDRFELEANGLVWIVDNTRNDYTVATVGPRRGTRVTCRIARAPTRSLDGVFREYTDEFEFMRTRTVVRLFEIGVEFVSRSEARRLIRGLDRFREVVVDFDRVASVGQGFADEVFRVFAGAHPNVRLVPVNMAPTVEFMVQRALVGARSIPK